MALSNPLLQAVRRYGPSVQGIAHQYGISGEALLAKLIQGESGGSATATSKAGAQGYTQFMPGTRRISIDRYGIDPLAGPDAAVHAAALHLRGKLTGSKGLRGYNPGGGQGYVDYILNQRVGDVRGARSGSRQGGGDSPGLAGRLSGSVTPGQVSGGGFDPGSPSGVSSLADLLSAQSQPVAPQLPAAPFSSSKYLHMGQAPVVSPQSAPESGLDSLLAQIGGSGQEIPETSVSAARTSVSGSAGSGPTATASRAGSAVHGRGTVQVAPTANRAGVDLTPGITKLVSALSARVGHPITVGTGTNHSHLTTNGRVSDHWEGNAADIPAAGDALIRLGQNALIAYGMDPAKARQQRGGLYNLPYGKHRRIQVIFGINDPARGGNHLDHLHVGVSPKNARVAPGSSAAGSAVYK